jgi:hemoglobin-like flavoprotein
MTPIQIQLVRHSFSQVAPIAPTAAAMFYDHLFAIDPTLRTLFRGDMGQQGERLMQMIGAAVGLLERPAQLMPVLQQLGARHVGYGVQAAHYDSVGTALLQTLADGLGAAFDEPTREAWQAMYAIVSSTMQAAAETPAAV